MRLRVYFSKDDCRRSFKGGDICFDTRRVRRYPSCKDQRKYVPGKGKEFDVYRKRSMWLRGISKKEVFQSLAQGGKKGPDHDGP